MEILQLLVSFLLENLGIDLSSIIEEVKENGFNIQSILKSISPDTIESIMSSVGNLFKNNVPTEDGGDYGLSPIISFADEWTVTTLNDYFLEENFN